MIVVDTQVMVYLLTGTGAGERAAALLRRDPEWTAPPILLSELRNVLVGFVRRGWLSERDALEIHDDAEAILGDRIASVPGLPVVDAALRGSLSAYDAEFVVLARQLGVPLVTADRVVLDGAPDVAVGL